MGSKIRKLFNLTDTDDVRKFVVRRKITTKGGKEYQKAPKIQRLVTPVQLQRKRHRAEKNKTEKAAYKALVDRRLREAKERRQELLQRRRSSHGSSHSAN